MLHHEGAVNCLRGYPERWGKVELTVEVTHEQEIEDEGRLHDLQEALGSIPSSIEYKWAGENEGPGADNHAHCSLWVPAWVGYTLMWLYACDTSRSEWVGTADDFVRLRPSYGVLEATYAIGGKDALHGVLVEALRTTHLDGRIERPPVPAGLA